MHTQHITVSNCPAAILYLSSNWTWKALLFNSLCFSSVQSLSEARQASLSITNSWISLRLTSIKSVMPSSHLILCRPLLLLPPIPPSISLFQRVSSSHEVATVLEFQLQHHSFQRNPIKKSLLQNSCKYLFTNVSFTVSFVIMFKIRSDNSRDLSI